MIKKHVQDPWFSYIKRGEKTVEGRLNKGSFTEMKVNDVVLWRNDNKSVKTKIISIHHHKSFENMLKSHSLKNTLPGIKTIKDGVNVYREFYSKKDEQKYGVLAIKLKIL